MTNYFYIIGCKGHAKSIASALKYNCFKEEIAVKMIDAYQSNSEGDLSQELNNSIKEGIKFIIGIGSNKKRQEIFEKLKLQNINYSSVIHPTAIVDKTASIGKGSFIGAGSYVGPDVKIGEHCIINTYAIVEHDSTIESFTHIGPNATCCGYTHVQKLCFVGASATISNNLTLGLGCTLGTGAVMIKDHIEPADSTFVGVPAKKI